MISYPKTPIDRLLWAYQFGHAWNRAPEYANLRNLDRGRILKMNGTEPDAKLLIASYQDFDPLVEQLVRLAHHRDLIVDGEVGPATEKAMETKRCGMTDFAPPADAELSTDIWDIPGLLEAIKSYQTYAAYRNDDKEYVGTSGSWPENAEYVGGRGSWPGPKTGGGCHPKRKDVHSKRVSVLTAGASSHQKAQLAEVLAAVERCQAEKGLYVEHVLDGDPKQAENDVRFQFIAGGVIGWSGFPRPDTCNQVIECRLDNSFNVPPKTQAELNVHEYDGHGDGLEHRNRTAAKKSIMHSAIGSPSDWPTWVNDQHEATVNGYFGGVAIPVEPTPGPGPTPIPTQRIWIRNTPNMAASQQVVALQDFVAKKDEVLGEFYYKSAQ